MKTNKLRILSLFMITASLCSCSGFEPPAVEPQEETTYYSFSFSGTNCAATYQNKYAEGTNVNLVITPYNGYELPSTITVTGNETYSYNKDTGLLSFAMTADTTVKCDAQWIDNTVSFSFVGDYCTCECQETYTIGTYVELTIVPYDGYMLPEQLETNLDNYIYNSTTGKLSMYLDEDTEVTCKCLEMKETYYLTELMVDGMVAYLFDYQNNYKTLNFEMFVGDGSYMKERYEYDDDFKIISTNTKSHICIDPTSMETVTSYEYVDGYLSRISEISYRDGVLDDEEYIIYTYDSEHRLKEANKYFDSDLTTYGWKYVYTYPDENTVTETTYLYSNTEGDYLFYSEETTVTIIDVNAGFRRVEISYKNSPTEEPTVDHMLYRNNDGNPIDIEYGDKSSKCSYDYDLTTGRLKKYFTYEYYDDDWHVASENIPTYDSNGFIVTFDSLEYNSEMDVCDIPCAHAEYETDDEGVVTKKKIDYYDDGVYCRSTTYEFEYFKLPYELPYEEAQKAIYPATYVKDIF